MSTLHISSALSGVKLDTLFFRSSVRGGQSRYLIGSVAARPDI